MVSDAECVSDWLLSRAGLQLELVAQKLILPSTGLACCAAAPQVSDFVHPVCGHTFSAPACWQRRAWEEKPPRCDKKVVHKRPCGHRNSVKCWESSQERLRPSPCMASVQARRPRCSHPLSLRCAAAAALLEAWEQHGGVVAVQAEPDDRTSVAVEHGVDYGASETQLAREARLHAAIPPCAVPVWCASLHPSHMRHAVALPAMPNVSCLV